MENTQTDAMQEEMQKQEEAVQLGLTFAEVNTLLQQKHGISVAKYDPLLTVVTINNAHLHEVQKLLEKHNKALTLIMSEASLTTIKAIQDEARIFAADFKDSAISSTVIKVNEHQRIMNNFLEVMASQAREMKIYAGCTLGASILFLLLTLGIVVWTR